MNRPLSAPLLELVSSVIEKNMGLHFPSERWVDLERGLRSAATDQGFPSVVDYATRLVTGDFNRQHANALAAHLTVGETYFFRDPALFEALTFQVIPALARDRRRSTRRLRIWCAGCCTGEEAYSTAITVRRALPDFQDWQITLLATDVNPLFLKKAAAGIYGRWSFRGVSDEIRDAWFRRTPDGRYQISPSVRQMVTFTCLNLVEDSYPSIVNDTVAMDLILCRNVLMYFSREQMRNVLGKFQRTLIHDGRLIVSATETSQELFREFSTTVEGGVTIYHKKPPTARLALAAVPILPKAAPLPQSPLRQVASPSPAPAPPAPDHAADAWQLANDGNLAEALAACDRALAAEKLDPAHHYLRGVILQEQGQFDPASAALQRALFLEPDFVIAHFALGHLLLRQQRTREAARCFNNTRALLSDVDPDFVLPESDGMTAGRLLATLESMSEAIS